MLRSKIRLGLLVLSFAVIMPQFGTMTFGQSSGQSSPTGNLETKVLIDSKGLVHVLWTVPLLNSSGSAPGVWYAKYEQNGTDAIPPTLIRNSSLVQAADMALDKFDQPHVAWAEGSTYTNSSGDVETNATWRLYYGEHNSTDPGHFTSTLLTNASNIVMWPSLAVDDNLTSHLVWTQLDVKPELTGGAYYGRVGTTMILNQTTLIASYNQTLISAPRPHLAFDRVSDNLHMVWVESTRLAGGRVVSSLSYAQVDLTTRNVTRLQLARFDEASEDVTLTPGSNGDAYVVWQPSGTSGSTRSVYVAQISRNGRVIFVKQLAQPATQAPAARLSVSADSQDNLYVVWYQPSSFPLQPASQTSRAPTSVAYLKLDRDGSLSESRSELVTGPLIAVAVSTSGDLYAISNQGIVRVTSPSNPLIFELIGVAAVSASTLGGALTTEEVRYRMLRSTAPIARKLKRKQEDDGQTENSEILRVLSRRPGLRIRELREHLRQEKATMIKLALLEGDGYVSSIRTGFARRFYKRAPQDLLDTPISLSNYEAIPSRILHEIEHNPGIWEAKLAKNLGLSQQIVHYHLRKMQAMGMLTAEPLAKRKHYWLRGLPHNKEKLGSSS